MLKSHGRYPYVPITRKTAGAWPGGARLAVYFALGVEEYVFGEGLTENLLPGASHPDLANTSWRDYGNRVGAFRILELFRGGDVPRQFDHQLAHGALLEPFANYLQRLQKRHARLDQRRQLATEQRDV